MSGLDEGSTDFRMRLQDFEISFEISLEISFNFHSNWELWVGSGGGGGWPISKRSRLARN